MKNYVDVFGRATLKLNRQWLYFFIQTTCATIHARNLAYELKKIKHARIKN